jgi:protein phosphatase
MRILRTSLGLDHQTRLFGDSQGKLLVVADGMGGHEAGERASQLAVDSIVAYVLDTLRWYYRLDSNSEVDFREELKAGLKHCQTVLQRDMDEFPRRRGMGTTLTMAYVIGLRMFVVHVGDSRCYLLRDGKLKRISRDHTMAQLYRETLETPVEGEAPEDEEASQWSSVLWNAIGADEESLHPEVYQVQLQLHDAVLLCTDGLTKHVEESKLRELLNGGDSSEATCRRMVDEANRRGGSDNITVVVNRIREGDGDSPREQRGSPGETFVNDS